MEVNKVYELEHDNKENIPPFLQWKKPGPNKKKVECALNESRRPLRDVTNVYIAATRPPLPSSLSLSGFSSNRKPRLVGEGDDVAHKSCSIVLRKGFR